MRTLKKGTEGDRDGIIICEITMQREATLDYKRIIYAFFQSNIISQNEYTAVKLELFS